MIDIANLIRKIIKMESKRDVWSYNETLALINKKKKKERKF